MTMMRLLLLALMLAPAGAAAQATPEAAAEQYLAAMQSGDWRRTATLVHPTALGELKSLFAVVAAADSAGQALQPIFRVPNAAEFDALPPAEVFARLLGTVSRTNPRLNEAMRGMRAEVVGSVPEGAEVAHVVYRMHLTIDGINSTRMDVLSVRRAGERWMALLSGDLKTMAEGMMRVLER